MFESRSVHKLGWTSSNTTSLQIYSRVAHSQHITNAALSSILIEYYTFKWLRMYLAHLKLANCLLFQFK